MTKSISTTHTYKKKIPIWPHIKIGIFYCKKYNISVYTSIYIIELSHCMKDIRKIWYYMIGWIIATLIDMSLLYIFTDVLHIHYLISQWLSFTISFIVGFLFQKYITFQNTSNNHIKEWLLFLWFQLIWLGINLWILHLSVERWWLHYMIGALLSKWIVFIRNFLMNKNFNFK